MSSAFAFIQRFVRDTAGLSLDDEKRYLVEDRLAPLMRAENLSSLDELVQQLARAPRGEFARTVTETLTINETSFFRDRGLFTELATNVLPSLIAARSRERHLRIWCAGCSSGQEPYSLAMVLDDHARALAGWRVELLATDLSRPVIETAKRGAYSQFEVQRGLPVTLLLRHFSREGDLWCVKDELRARVAFRTHNLVAGVHDLGRFDLVFCRNVLIYFDVPTKRRVLASLGSALADDGYMALGATEVVGGLTEDLRPVAGQRFLFRKPGAAPVRDRASAIA